MPPIRRQVDAGGLAEAVLRHVTPGRTLSHAHRPAPFVVVGVDRVRDRLAQVGPALAAGESPAAASCRAGGIRRRTPPCPGGAGAAVEAGQRGQRLQRRPRATPPSTSRLNWGARDFGQRSGNRHADAVDEQVGELAGSDHRRGFAGARITATAVPSSCRTRRPSPAAGRGRRSAQVGAGVAGMRPARAARGRRHWFRSARSRCLPRAAPVVKRSSPVLPVWVKADRCRPAGPGRFSSTRPT